MKTRLTLLLAAAVLSGGPESAVAQPPQKAAREVRKQTDTSYARLVADRAGRRVLVIDYPWKTHQHPSVEVRLVTDEATDTRGLQPLFFTTAYLKGTVTVDVYHCQDEAAGAGARHRFTENEIYFEIIGQKNSLGRPAVCVVREVPSSDSVPGVGVVYCLLEPWSVNNRLLYLELPPERFVEPGKLYVWFLRADKVLWEEVEQWPGTGK